MATYATGTKGCSLGCAPDPRRHAHLGELSHRLFAGQEADRGCGPRLQPLVPQRHLGYGHAKVGFANSDVVWRTQTWNLARELSLQPLAEVKAGCLSNGYRCSVLMGSSPPAWSPSNRLGIAIFVIAMQFVWVPGDSAQQWHPRVSA